MTLTVSEEADWAELRPRQLTAVLDPMVVRTADLFISGASAVGDDRRDTVWHAIDATSGRC